MDDKNKEFEKLLKIAQELKKVLKITQELKKIDIAKGAELEKQVLLEEIKKRYPLGTKFRDIKNKKIQVVETENYSYFEGSKSGQVGLSWRGWLFHTNEWAEIVEKPIFTDEKGKFWYKSDFKSGDIIYHKTDSFEYFVEFNYFNRNIIVGKSYIRLENSEFYKIIYSNSIIEDLRFANKEEKEWYNKCKKLEKFVPKDEKKWSLKITKESLLYIAQIYDKYVWSEYSKQLEKFYLNKYITSHNISNGNYIFSSYPGSNHILNYPNSKYTEISTKEFCRLMGLKYKQFPIIEHKDFKIEDKVEIIDTDYQYTTYKEAFEELGFPNTEVNANEDGVTIGFIFNIVKNKDSSETLIALNLENGEPVLIEDKGIVKFNKKEQPLLLGYEEIKIYKMGEEGYLMDVIWTPKGEVTVDNFKQWFKKLQKIKELGASKVNTILEHYSTMIQFDSKYRGNIGCIGNIRWIQLEKLYEAVS